MELYSSKINKLIEELAALPGIGAKSAARLAFYLINEPEEHVKRLSEAMMDAKQSIHYCKEIVPINSLFALIPFGNSFIKIFVMCHPNINISY